MRKGKAQTSQALQRARAVSFFIFVSLVVLSLALLHTVALSDNGISEPQSLLEDTKSNALNF